MNATFFDVYIVVVDAVDFPDGKWPTALGNVLVLESSYAQTLLGPAFQLLTGASPSTFKIEVCVSSNLIW